MNDSINTINDALVERYKVLQEIQENQFRVLKEKYEAEVKLNILQIQKESVFSVLTELNAQRDALKEKVSGTTPETVSVSQESKLVNKTAFNMQPTVTSKTNKS